MPNAYETYLTRDVYTKEERAVILWRMAQAIYEVHSKAFRIDVPFAGIPIAEREVWIHCARAAMRALTHLDPKDDPLPLEM